MTAAAASLDERAAGAPAGPAPAARKRRGAAAVLSAALHGAVLLVALVDVRLPDRAVPRMPEAIPVEIVMPTATEPEPPPEQAAPEAPAPPPAKAAPRVPAGGERMPPEVRRPPAAETAPGAAETLTALVGPRGTLRPVGRPTAPADGADGGYAGDWILDPLRIDYGHRCGPAELSGRLNLTEARGDGRFRGVLRTTIDWARCPAEGARFQVLLTIQGGRVVMAGSGGFVDRGVVEDGVMRLTDAYGASVWRKR